MKTTVRYTGTMAERLEQATKDAKEYLTLEKFDQLVSYLRLEYEQQGIRQAIRMTRVYCMIAGIEGLPVRAILIAATGEQK